MPGWEPLPLIVYGYAVHPLVPASRRDTRYSTRTRHSAVSERYADDRLRDVVSLEVGDEIYAFEQYVPKGKEVDGEWYRGYVVTSTRRPPTNWQSLADPSSNATWEQMSDETQVILGIFPASHVHVRDYFPDAENRLAAITLAFEKSLQASHNGNGHEHMQDQGLAIGRSSKQRLRDDEDDTMTRKSFRIAPPREQKSSSQRAALTVYPPSIRSRSSSPSPTENGLGMSSKPHPPRPILKSSDETASGVAQPLVDEIASAIREWHHLLYRHLARRDYRLFATVRDHIDALHLGRRQLIAQTLSETETQALRRTCIARLVRGNIIQGLDIIVRHPVWGGLVTVSTDVDSDPHSWMTAIRMYALSVSLAFIETRMETAATAVALTSRLSSDTISHGNASTPAKSTFPEIAMLRGSSLRGESSALAGSENSTKARKLPQFYHVFIEVRAFVASLCAPGETAELFFSLYNKSAEHFMTEDFCAVLNHNGVLARNPAAKIRALFVDLVPSEALDTIYLVCRIVRNGALKLGNNFSTGAPDTPSLERRASQASFMQDDRNTSSSPSHMLNGAGRLVTLNDSPNFRRPFGCAVLELTQLSALAAESGSMSSTREHTLPIWVPSQEAAFAMIHNDVIAHNTRELEKSPRAEGVAVSVKIFHGDADTVVREHSSLLQDVPLTLRLGFPDVVFPGVQRNEVYVKLWSGDFSSAPAGGSRLSMVNFRGNMGGPANNIEVMVEVRDKHGRVVEEPVISMGTGEPGTTSFRSMIFQRNNTPTFGELFKIHLPTSGQAGWHLFLTLRKRASNEGRNNSRINEADRPFAFGYLPLFPRGRTFLEDGGHTLVLYRADKLANISADMYLSATPCHPQGQQSEQINISPEMQRLAPSLRDTISVRTSLTSTRLTQEPFLASLLDWRHSIRDQEQLETMLGKFVFVAETDIVKFLGDIFDALFGIISAPVGSHGKTGVLVLKCLVTVLGIVQDRRFSNFLPVLDVYIQRHYNHPDAGLRIVHAFNHLIADPSPESASSLRSALKVWNYLFKFIGRSLTLLRTRSTPAGDVTAQIDEDYRDALSAHLNEINKLMALPTPPSIIGTQTIALQHFTSIFPQLNQVFPTDELVDIAILFMRANPTNKGKIEIWKLIALLHFVKDFLFDEAGPRARLVEETVIWIKPHFGRFDEYAQVQEGENAIDSARVQWLESSRLCVTIVAVMLDKLQQCLVDPAIASDPKKLRAETDNVELIAPLLPRLFATYQEFASPTSHEAIRRSRQPHLVASGPPVTFPESYPFSLIARMPSRSPSIADKRDSLSTLEGALFNVGLGETAIVILVIACSAPKAGLQDWLSQTLEIEGKDNMTALLNQTFSVAQSILDNEAFPKNWLNLNIFAHVALIRLMDAVADTLEKQYIPVDENPLDAIVWRAAISTLLQLLSSEQLVIEELSPQRGRSVWRLAGDIRGDGGAVLYHLWNALGMPEAVSAQYGAVGRFWGHQAALGNLVDQVVHLCMSHHDQLRLHAVQILYSMIMTEYHTLENFTRIENEVVNKLDTLFTEKSQGDETSRSFFITQLRALFESSNTDERLRDRVNEFLESVDSFLDLLLSVRALPEGEEFADDRVIATLRLMNYLRRSGRDEMYIKYVHQLVNMHIQSSNHVEAALTLQLHADLHEWDLHSFVPAMEDLGLPRQSQFHRKETLCLLILDYLGKGKAWEKAIELCKELAYQHQEVSYNYGRLSEILKYQAMLLEHIVTEQRYYPEYFRVTFFGNFPAAVRHKSIVYRGFDWEKLGAFCDRMLQKHPGAQILKGAGDPPPDVRFGSTQYIQILGVKPEPNKDLPIFSNPNVPVQVKAYYEHNATNIFSFFRPLTKHARDGSEEVWTEKTYLTTEAAFPTVLRRSEVVQSQTIYISPVESALADLEEKTRELAGLYMRYSAVAQTGQAVPTNQFSMTLNASVDMAGDAGVNLYRRTFLTPEYLQLWPDRLDQVKMLRKVVDEHVMTLETCLRLHGRVCPPEMLPFHETLEGDFRRNFKPEIQRFAADGLSEFDYANSISPSTASNHELLASVYPGASKASFRYSVSSGSTSRAPFMIPPLQLGASSPVSPSINSHQMFSQELLSDSASSRPTPLKKSLQHLAKHGLTGVSSPTREPTSPASEAQSVNSPKGSSSFINFVPAPTMAAAPALSGSGPNSIRSRFSRLGNSIMGRD